MKDDKKFNIILFFLVVITVLSLMILFKDEVFGKGSGYVTAKISKEQKKSSVALPPALLSTADLRSPGGYYWKIIQKLVAAGQRDINYSNTSLDMEECKQAYWDYYTKSDRRALMIMHKCEK